MYHVLLYGIALMHHSLFHYLFDDDSLNTHENILFITITLTMIFHLHFFMIYKEWHFAYKA